MRDEEFFHYLMNEHGITKPAARDARARCRKVERELKKDPRWGYKFNLDSQYLENRCESVIDFLEYGNREAFSALDLPQKIDGLSSLRSAVRSYVSFCDFHKPEESA
ncbi:MAG: hypothetical protein IKN96_09525 [Oscillibacter sp.]|nr:hypothetical protein [Oscillibacter sp.]